MADWAASNNVEIAYTPTNNSWLNRIEAQFTALRYFTLDGTDAARRATCIRPDTGRREVGQTTGDRSVAEQEEARRLLDAFETGRHVTGQARKTHWRTTATTATFPEAVRENKEVVPVNAVSTWVLPSGVTVGR
ncbi:hypothetical protein [Micromonospora sp. MA102]|uniref:hypothetical protein n=1 Tax=Micromonospora sp. MA102 TaxID=2952755 RepID=UPI0021C86B49|nr:hypothetical protein [Micromonospora sp. MA102]